nr:NADH-plastoquinone oxidoreductase subunit 3 [Champereia manillana var. longistaminea]
MKIPKHSLFEIRFISLLWFLLFWMFCMLKTFSLSNLWAISFGVLGVSLFLFIEAFIFVLILI